MSSFSRNRRTTAVQRQDVQEASELSNLAAADVQAPPGEPFLHQNSVHANPVHAQGWPVAPIAVKRSFTTQLLDLITDIVLLAAAASFLSFAIAAFYYDGKATSGHPQAKKVLDEASQVGPTIFPILFACITGRAAQVILLWRLEAGERIGILDLLAGSTSLTSTVTSQIQLRMLTVFGAILVAIWALSPIGGQASLRQVRYGSSANQHSVTLTYAVPSARIGNYFDYRGRQELALANNLFTAAVLAPKTTKQSTTDLWGNLKIPMLEPYENMTTSDRDGWFSVRDGQPVYASLVGTPLIGNDRLPATDYTFSLETSYLYLSCPVVNEPDDRSLAKGSHCIGTGVSVYFNYNASCGSNDLVTLATGNPGRKCKRPKNNDASLPRNFTYKDETAMTDSVCIITTTHVEVQFICPAVGACGATDIRRSKKTHPPSTSTVLSHPGYFSGTDNFGFLACGLVGVFHGQPNTPNPISSYLHNPDNPASYASFSTETLTDKDGFAIRMGQLVNAYWTCLTSAYFITGDLVTGIGSSGFGSSASLSTTQAIKRTTFDVFVCVHPWAIILLVTSLILISACLIHPVMLFWLHKGPDLMVNVSSLVTRDNPHIPIPENGTALDASRRARLVKDVRIKFGDVEPDKAVGRLAITSIGKDKGNEVTRAMRGRLYA